MEIFARQGAPPVSTTPVVNLLPVSMTRVEKFSTIFPSDVDTGGQFDTGVNDAAGANNANGKLPPISTTPAANFPPVSWTPVAKNGNNYQTADNLK